MKLINRIIFSIVCFCVAGSAFAQEFSDKEIGFDAVGITAKLKESGVGEKNIQQEISNMRSTYKHMFALQQKQKSEILEKIKDNQKSSATNRNVLDISPSEKSALQALYNATDGNNWLNKTGWDFNTPVTSWNGTTGWYGVVVSSQGNVIGLNLINNGLKNTIPDLSNLTKLQALELGQNPFMAGTMPSWINNLDELIYLNLAASNFYGTIPNISSLVDLQSLNIYGNNFTAGPIPSYFYNFTSLKYLNLEGCNLTGNISNIGSFPNLEWLYLGGNNLVGGIPSQITGLSNLKGISLHTNPSLGGNIPTGIGSLTNLQILLLANNNLSGNLPSGISQLTNLQSLWIQNNNLDDTIPSLAGLTNLYQFYFENNHFRFIDFINQFTALKNSLNQFGYTYQKKIDTPITLTRLTGQPANFKMCMNDRYHAGDTYQWFKNGTLISGATNRIYTISSVISGDAGVYVCKSYHTTSPDMSPLVLEREPITLTVSSTPQLNECPEGFEGETFPPAGWAVYDNGVGTVQWSGTSDPTRVYAGAKAAMIDRENVGTGNTSIDWLVTPRFAVPANGELRFFTKEGFANNQGSTFEVRVSTNSTQSNTAAFTSVQSWTEITNATYNVYKEVSVDLSAYPAGTQIYVAFVKTNTQPTFSTSGDRWMIDNVRVVEKCIQPVNLRMSSCTANSATLTWNTAPGVSQWEVEIVPAGTTPTHTGTIVSTNTYLASGLTQGVLYDFYIRAICSSCETNNGLWTAQTIKIPGYCDVTPLTVVRNGTSATLSWESQMSNSWTIEYFNLLTTNVTQIVVNNSTSVVINNLLPNEFYQFRIKSNTGQNCPWVAFPTEISACNMIAYAGGQELLKTFFNTIIQNIFTNNYANYSNPDSGASTSLINPIKPIIGVANPKLYNFSYQNNIVSFSFTSGATVPDVSFYYDNSCLATLNGLYFPFSLNGGHYQNITGLLICNGGETQIPTLFNFNNFNFCVEDTNACFYNNPQTADMKAKLVALLNKVNQMLLTGPIPDGTQFAELTAMAPFVGVSDPKYYSLSGGNDQVNFFKFTFSPNGQNYIWFAFAGLTSNVQYQINDVLFYEDSPIGEYHFDVSVGNNYWVYGRNFLKGVNVCPSQSCTATNPRTVIVKNAFKALVNKLLVLDPATIVNGYTCSELTALAPYITDANPAIYNFTIDESANQIRFSFAPHGESEDVVFQFSHPMVEDVSQLSLMTNFNVNSFASPETYTNGPVNFAGDDYSGQTSVSLKIKHINFCPPSISCTATNPNSAVVNKLFVKLVQKLIKLRTNSPSDASMNGISVPELNDMAMYITDATPGIYNFASTYTSNGVLKSIKFSFLPNENAHDVLIDGWQSTFPTANNYQFDLSGYENSSTYLNITGNLYNSILVKNIQIRHIDFCPDDICVNHVALVVDESGSIDDYEKAKIKRQLRKFIKKQADLNDSIPNWNMHISLIGMSDSDVDTRTDHVLYKRVSNLDASLAEFMKWLDGPTPPDLVAHGEGYGARYGRPVTHPGVSGGSDYWKSGLDRALSATIPPKLVVMITDGSQTANTADLKTTMAKFDNISIHNGTPDITKPHLYVIGIDNGFYVYDEQSALRQLPRNEDPNFVPSLRSSSLTSRTTPALVLSLKYLWDLENDNFPVNTANTVLHPIEAPEFDTDDYIGMANMDIIGDPESTFLADNMNDVYVECGSIEEKDPCDDCFSFQPMPGYVYVLNAWVKEELNVQVKEYASPKITLRFLDFSKTPIVPNVSVPSPYVFVDTPAGISFKPKGDIIEGWQRIGAKFEVPENAVYMEFELVNESNSVPVFFDDIRIYPIKGSMKSFVYDPENFRLMSELDENNYATYYEYDNEGGLVRIKKETVKGIKTIQETRSGNVIKIE